MAAVLSALRTEVRTILTRTDFTDAQINTRINWIIREIAHKEEVDELEVFSDDLTLIQSVDNYELPTDLDVLRTVKIKGEDEYLLPMSHREWASVDRDEEGEPRRYFRFGSSIYLYQKPDSGWNGYSLTIAYKKFHPALTSDGEAHLLPDFFDEVIVLGAAYRSLRDTMDLENARMFYMNYRDLWNQYSTDRAREYPYGVHRVRIPSRRFVGRGNV